LKMPAYSGPNPFGLLLDLAAHLLSPGLDLAVARLGALLVPTPIPFPVPEAAKLIVAVELSPQLLNDELDHDRVVEEPEAEDVVGDEVPRIGEVRERRDRASARRGRHRPAFVLEHSDEQLEPIDAALDVVRRLRIPDALDQLFRGSNGSPLVRGLRGLSEYLAQALEVASAELERDLKRRHRLSPRSETRWGRGQGQTPERPQSP
jgi:hypothetical protein